jgi:uncharacterized metal-binding protein (TIGR02443 family)
MADTTTILKKQFIAGAVCPDCREVDRIVVETGVNAASREVSRRRCVVCGFADLFAEVEPVNSASGQASVPRGRPERIRSPSVKSVQVRMLDPKDTSL